MPKIIVTSRCIKPTAHKKFGNYIKCIATHEGVKEANRLMSVAVLGFYFSSF